MSEPGVLQYDGVTGRHVIRLGQGQWAGRAFTADLSVCPSPFCGCATIGFACVPLDVDTPGGPTQWTFSLDVLAGRIADPNPDKAPPSPEGHALAQAVCAELRDADWQALYSHLLDVKQDVIEAVDASTAIEDIPPEIMAEDGCMVEYGEIFPLADRLPFSVGDHHWIVDDQYCVDPDCKCTGAVLTFIRLPDEMAGGEEPRIEGSRPALYYDYRRSSMTPEHEPAPVQPPLKTMLESLKRMYPDFNALVHHRHLQLRVLHLRALVGEKPDAIQPVDKPPKTGRNEPCPCGSGKKYKKCCGR